MTRTLSLSLTLFLSYHTHPLTHMRLVIFGKKIQLRHNLAHNYSSPVPTKLNQSVW
jgi:hypothetical protein